MTQPLIIVASLLPENGYCGVQTHARALSAYARGMGYDVQRVDPYQINHWLRRGPSLIGRVLRQIAPEVGVLWSRMLAKHYMRLALRMCLRMAKGRTVVVYAQDPLSAQAALVLRREGFALRIVTVLHFNISEAYEYKLNKLTREGGVLWRNLMRVENEVLPMLDKVIFVSNYMRSVVVGRNPSLKNVEQYVIPNFPEKNVPLVSRYVMRADIISIGTLEPRKNQSYLLQMLAEAKRQGYRYSLTLVGDGPSRPELEALAVELGIADQVEFLGYVYEAYRLLAEHRVYAHAALMENLPITLIEALACGLPIFALPVGGIPEVFSNGVEGFYLSFSNISESAERIINVLENVQILEEMSVSAHQRYHAQFSSDVVGPIWVSTVAG